MTGKNLFGDFEAVSKTTWLNKVEKDLKGKPLESLNWQLEEAVTLAPFYHSDDQILANFIPRNQADNDWSIGESILIKNPSADNQRLLEALKKGTNAPLVLFETVPDLSELTTLFDQVIPTYIEISFAIQDGSSTDYQSLIQSYHNYLSTKGHDTKKVKGLFYINTYTEGVGNNITVKFPGYRHSCLDIRGQASQTNIVAQLVDFLAKADQFFQKIEADQVQNIFMSCSLSNSYFVEIAKIRAARLLWTNLLAAYQVKNSPLYIDAHIAADAYDENPNTNMIRSMTIALAAVIGGVDRLTVRPAPSDKTQGDRIARNVQHLLKMESYLDRVIDPAAGSYYIEQLTNSLAKQAWEQFKIL